MSEELDLNDPMIRDMADRNHTPDEMWTVGGDLLSTHCSQCGQGWPCSTRRALRAQQDDKDRRARDHQARFTST